MKRKALGKGLDSLIPSPPAARAGAAVATPPPHPQTGISQEGLRSIDLDLIRPNRRQPRQAFDEVGLEELAASLRVQGMLQPIVVRPTEGGTYELIAGERRWRAAQRAGLLRVPAVIRSVDDDRLLEYALIENLQREDLNPIEEAQAYRALLDDHRLTQQELADRISRPRTSITNSLRLLGLPDSVQDRVRSGELSMGHARALAGLGKPAEQVLLAGRIVDEGLSVRQVETLVARAIEASGLPTSEAPARPDRDPNVVAAEESLGRALGTKVRIVQGRKGGRLEIHYFGEEELQRVYELLVGTGRRRS